ncbi:MAG: polysaccharide pyruvyl transferase family protein [Thermodesulfobacteriota bacterium]|nr:MAG: polysaccharide pyruvyl transferase family protein [Thermodesulfobacteriota bacterium]
MKVFLLGASFNTRNMGVGALTAGALKCILNWSPQAEIGMLDYARAGGLHNFSYKGREVLVRLVNIRFSKRFYLPNNIALLILLAALARIMPGSIRRKIIGGNATLSELHSADMAASIAGGDSLSDIYGLGRFMYVALPQLLVILMGKQLIQLPQTYGPYRSRLSRAVTRFLLDNSTMVFSRDYEGIAEVRRLLGILGMSEKVQFCHDVGFVLDPVKPEDLEIEGAAFDVAGEVSSIVGLNVSGLLYMGGYTGDNMFNLRLDYRLLVREVIDFLVTKKRAHVVLIPHVFGGSEHPESDAEACRKVYDELKAAYGPSLSLVTGDYGPGEIKSIIGQCGFFIGSRMHSCIAALSQGVPAVAIAYSDKFKGVMETVGAGSSVADPCSLDSEGVLGVIEKAYEERAAMSADLKAVMPGVRENVLSLFYSLAPEPRRETA